MKTNKRFLSVLLGLVMMLGLMCGLSVSAMVDTEWADLQNAINSASNEAIINVSVYAGADKKIVAPESAGALTIDSGKNITLDLDGCIIDRGLTSATDTGNVITVTGTLTVTDTGTGGKITGGNNNGNGGGVIVSGKFDLKGGTIIGNTDFTVSWTKDGTAVTGVVSAGDYTATVTGIGKYRVAKPKTVTFTIQKTAPAVTAPVAKTNLSYTGSALTLITPGSVNGGTMQYAPGTETGANEPYTTSIPAKTDAGTYYVWYKAVGDENHTDSAADKVEVTISPPSSQGGGEVIGNGEKSTEELKEEFKNEPPKDDSAAKKVLGENATTADAIDALAGEQKTELINSAINDAGNLKIEGEGAKLNDVSDIATAVLDTSELVQVVLGDNIVIDLKVADKPESSVNTATKNKIVETAGAKANNGLFFFDADLFVTVNNGEPTPVTKFAKAISFTKDIPESLRGAGRQCH